MKTHSFDIDDAKKYGVECAVILHNFRFWLDKNKANRKNIKNGRVWTYNSNKALAELFPYLSEKQIYRRMQKLEDEGIIISDNHNKHEYDRTKWYTIDESGYCINQNEGNHSPKSENGNSEMGEPIPDSKPDIKPFKKQRETRARETPFPEQPKDDMKETIRQALKGIPIPDSIDTVPFRQAIFNWCLMMWDTQKKLPQAQVMEMHYKHIAELNSDPVKVVEQSIMGQNKSFFELRSFERKQPAGEIEIDPDELFGERYDS